jgi:hypothetical protein
LDNTRFKKILDYLKNSDDEIIQKRLGDYAKNPANHDIANALIKEACRIEHRDFLYNSDFFDGESFTLTREEEIKIRKEERHIFIVIENFLNKNLFDFGVKLKISTVNESQYGTVRRGTSWKH